MLVTIAAILVILWLLGITIHITTGFLHLLLVVAIAVFLYDWFVVKKRQ